MLPGIHGAAGRLVGIIADRHIGPGVNNRRQLLGACPCPLAGRQEDIYPGQYDIRRLLRATRTLNNDEAFLGEGGACQLRKN